jgi:DNA polymerase-3 subunit delta
MRRQSSDESRASQAEFHRRLKAGRIDPVYLLEGSESYLRDTALRELIEAAVDPALQDFNLTMISVSAGDLDRALAVALQLPMMAARRAVVVSGFEQINDERQLELLKNYLRDPGLTTSLIFVTDGLDNRRAIATLLRKSAFVVSFAPLEEKESAPRWIADYVARAGVRIDESAAAYLVGTIGADLRRLVNEAEKLINYVGERGRITRAEIDELVRYSREHSNFELSDAVIDGDRRRALRLLDHIFANPPEAPSALALMMIGALARAYRQLLTAKELMRQDAPNSEIAKAVGLSPYIVTRLNERARRMDEEGIRRGIVRIAEADLALKTSLAVPRLQLEFLICELCPEGERASGRHRQG